MPWTSWPAATRRGTSCFPIAPVAPATNTLIINPFIEDFTFTPQDKTAAPAVTPPSTPARESGRGVQPLKRASPTHGWVTRAFIVQLGLRGCRVQVLMRRVLSM